MNLDIDCLRTLVLVADTMSFSRAAEAVGRSQSTISAQIAKLEGQIGEALLSRRKGKVLQLTPHGDCLVNYARRILQLNDEACRSMSEEPLDGFIRLGVPLDFFGRELAAWLAQFKAKHPMVGLEVEANQSEGLQKRSARGEFDLAFFKQDMGAQLGTVAQREQLVWVAGPNFECDEMNSIPLVLFPEGCLYRRCALASLKLHGSPSHISFVGPGFDSLKSAAIDGMGITVLARALVKPPLKIVPHGLRLPQLPAVELAYSQSQRSNSRVVNELTNHLADSLAMADQAPADRPHLVDARTALHAHAYEGAQESPPSTS
ncbi:LysR substrate-binding domain-containing protein [Bradyrhizobium sp. CCBAU 45384]|uniref:LysR substrate-binding domain-containing protein n=1 Tax=Bradyrhizobium sp. CCBAU 45384 TaxID=858428 RepID=UPI002304F391|nr:LysR substrate-binding domain-containing protein [Bradyrhizobium sp. CCBAU 45384]MDA9406228.1 LysR family transcriptional regulator [Bradyrhizobium sp. CCBAU 45384]